MKNIKIFILLIIAGSLFSSCASNRFRKVRSNSLAAEIVRQDYADKQWTVTDIYAGYSDGYYDGRIGAGIEFSFIGKYGHKYKAAVPTYLCTFVPSGDDTTRSVIFCYNYKELNRVKMSNQPDYKNTENLVNLVINRHFNLVPCVEYVFYLPEKEIIYLLGPNYIDENGFLIDYN